MAAVFEAKEGNSVLGVFATISQLRSERHANIIAALSRIIETENAMETVITKAQKFLVLALAVLLTLVVVLSTVHLGVLVAEEVWKTPRFLIPVQGLLDISDSSCWFLSAWSYWRR